jgi:hypothetical protein
MEYYSAIKRNEVLIHATKWMNLKIITELIEARYKSQMCIVYFYLCKMSRTGKSIEMESRLMIARGCRRGNESNSLMDREFFGVIKMFGTKYR